MKILRVISSMHPSYGGPSQGVRNSIPYLQELGVINEVVCMDDKYINYNTNDGFSIYKIGNGKSSYQYQPLLLIWLKKYLSNYDVVIVHGLWQYHNYAVCQAVKVLKTNNKKVPKVVIMPHGMLDPYFQKARDRKWKALRNELVWFFIEKKCINEADAIFYTCKEEMRLATTTFKRYNPKKAIDVGYGIQMPPENNADFKESFYKICPAVVNQKYLLFLSRIHEKKGVDLLIKAYNELFQENSILPHLVIAGPIESDYAQEMIQLASNNPMIHFSGMLTGMAKWGAFYNCNAYILPSQQENFGIAIVEAMACKKPVLITKNVNIWREIDEGNGGWILDELHVDSLKKQLINITSQTDMNLEIRGLNAFQTYRNKFDVEVCASVFAETLEKL